MNRAFYHAIDPNGPARSKYGNVKTEVDGYKFDSRAEAERYVYLRNEQNQGRIAQLKVHPKFTLLPPFTPAGTGKKERGVTYSADFQYVEDGKEIVEDVKSPATARDKTFRVKIQFFLAKYPQYLFRVIAS